MLRIIIALTATLALSFGCRAVVPSELIRFHCDKDTVLIQQILDAARGKSGAEAMIAILDGLKDMKYSPNTLSEEDEHLVINLHEGDDLTLIQTAVALRGALKAAMPGWRHFADELESVRYRKGEIYGFPSRLMYMSEWIADNTFRGHVKELTSELGAPGKTNRSLTYFTTHRDKFPQMKDDNIYERMRDIEMGFRQLGISYLRKETIGGRDLVNRLQDGDIIIIMDRSKDMDYSEIFFARLRDGKVYMQKFDKAGGDLVISERPLDDYFRHEGRNALGYRVVRVTD